MTDPVFWLGLSVGLVAAGLLGIFVALIPAAKELGEAARSVKKFFDTLQRDLPPTLEALRLTGLEVSEIADSLDDGVKSAGRIVKRVDGGIEVTRSQVQNVSTTTRSVAAGIRAGWKAFTEEESKRSGLSGPTERDRLPPEQYREQ